MKKIQKRTKYR